MRTPQKSSGKRSAVPVDEELKVRKIEPTSMMKLALIYGLLKHLFFFFGTNAQTAKNCNHESDYEI